MFVHPKTYDVIVVGAGHAGIEAALASARMGCSTLLLTINCDTIGQMSCNPAIGGLAKGHLVREIDALGGEMGRTTDFTGLQFRMLNTKKGPSVWAPRAQCDKKAYQFRMKWVCERTPNLEVRQAQTTGLLLEDRRVLGVTTALDVAYRSTCVVVTTGTFLRGLMHIGANQQKGGRAGEGAAMNLSDALRDAGLELGRLKTGTPPRLLKRTIDFSRTEIQPGDDPPPLFSFWNDEVFLVEPDGGLPGLPRLPHDAFFPSPTFPGLPNRSDSASPTVHAPPMEGSPVPKPTPPPVDTAASTAASRPDGTGRYLPGSILAQIGGQLPCYITFTTDRTAELIRANLHRSPMYSGVIEGIGPRYCPSIEDKIVRFADKERHQIFLEPEGIATDEIYVNGFSTSLPYDVQIDLVRSIIGCENAEILRPAYAVEYDFAPPTQLSLSLETKVCSHLFLAGQINGTSGYEEAAAQGLMAGINAARKVLGKEPVILRRDQAYIGVLIDDLVTKGTAEPYRMFTSRAEYRLLLRQDNASLRLTPLAYDLGLVSRQRFDRVLAQQAALDTEIQRLDTTRVDGVPLSQLLRRPEITYDLLPSRCDTLAPELRSQVEITLKYQGYIQREQQEVERFHSLESKRIPADFDYDAVPSLRREARLKLGQIRPSSLGQASRISGVNPSDISILMVWLRRRGDPAQE